MPLQGHWQRVNTPLRETTSRERVLVRVVGALVGIAVIASIIVVIVTSGGSESDPTCVNVDVPSTMGGGAIHACGNDAASLCHGPAARRPPLNATILEKCRDAGYEGSPGSGE